MSESRSYYYDTMPGWDIVDEQLHQEYRVSSKALQAAVQRHNELLTVQATDLNELHNRRPPQGSLASRDLLSRIAHQTEELEELAARITNLRAYVAHVLQLAHQQANERVAAEVLGYGRPSKDDEGPQEATGSFVIRER
jgi:capsid protein